MGETKYNPQSKEWELVGKDWECQFNPHNNEIFTLIINLKNYTYILLFFRLFFCTELLYV